MRCGKPEHLQGQKCAAKNAKCKECHKIGHFYKVCQSKKRTRRANLAQAASQNKNDTHIDECSSVQPNPPLVNMLKIVIHIGTTSGTQEKHLKFPIDVDVRGPYKHHLVITVDTGADVNCINEKTFKKLFPKVKLDVCPYEIQNFGNSTADISILGQFPTYLRFRGKKYLNTFIVTNANNCPNLLSHGATFRMGVLLPNYLEENVVKGENVPNFKVNTCTGLSNVFQILQDLWLKQTRSPQPSTIAITCIATQPTPLMTYSSTLANQNTETTCLATPATPLMMDGYSSANQNIQSTGMATPITSMSESLTFPRTTMPAETTTNLRHQNSLRSELPTCCMHVHKVRFVSQENRYP